MTLEQIKNEIKTLKSSELQELSTLILQLKRAQDPNRKGAIADLLDSPDRKWVLLEDAEKKLNEE